MKKLLLSLTAMLFSMMVSAQDYDFEINNIYYKYNSDGDLTLSVTSGPNKDIYYTGEVVIPSAVEMYGQLHSVTAIASNAFWKCENMSTVIIPDGVNRIEAYAFSGCTSLSVIQIPTSVYDIGEEAFSQTQWYNVQPQGLVYAGNVFYCYKGEMPDNYSVELKEGTTGIAGRAFTNNGSNLSSVYIPEGVKAIGNRAFQGCKLTSLSLPNSIFSIGYMAFQGCIDLKEINIPLGVSELRGEIFQNCKSLTKIEIPLGVSVIGDNEFGECRNLAKLVIADSDNELTFLRGYGKNERWCFTDCPLDSVYIGRNIKGRYDYSGYNLDMHLSPFYGKTTITYVDFGGKVTEINQDAFSKCTGISSIVIPENVKLIGISAFSGCENITKIILPDALEELGSYAFSDCLKLDSVKLSLNLNKIDNCTFKNCANLTSISIPGAVREVEVSAFIGCNLSEIRFEDSLLPLSFTQSIGWSPFSQFPLEKMYVGRNLSGFGGRIPFDLTIGKNATELRGFQNCMIKTLTIEDGKDTLCLSYSSVYASQPFNNAQIDSIYLGRSVIGKDTWSNASFCPFSSTNNSFSMRIGNNIEVIGDYAYSGWKISTLYIPKNVKKIGASPFNSCAYLHDVFIEDCDEPLEFNEEIGFYGIQLNNLYLGRNISYPEDHSPFSRNKEALKNLTLGNHVTEIGNAQFAGCLNLSKLDFPKSLRKIGNQAFYGCEGLTSLSIPGNVEEVGKDAFNLCRGLTYVSLEDSEESLAIDNNFMNCELKKVYLGRNIVYPEHMSPFSGLDCLDSLIIGKRVTNLGKSIFAACQNLKDVISYAEVVPETNEYTFTQSYLPYATLHVPYNLYDKYRVMIPWSLFGKIVNFEGLYNLTYFVDNDEYSHSVVEQGSEIVVEEEPEKEGYTFSGWSAIPEIMPDHDVTITGSFIANKYKVTYMIDGDVFTTDYVEFGASIVPPTVDDKEGYTFDGWMDVPETMPAHDITIYGSFTSGIAEIGFEHTNDVKIYTVNGNRISRLQRGVNIIRYSDGRVRKINVK